MSPTPRLAIRVDRQLIERIDAEARKDGVDRSTWIRRALETVLQRRSKWASSASTRE